MKLLIPCSLLCSLLLCAVSAAQVQGPNLAITNFSVWSTQPGTDGQRRMAISFRVVNTGTLATGATTTQITVAGNVTSYATPALAPQAAVFFTQTLETTQPVAIQIATNVAPPILKERQLKRRRIHPPPGGVAPPNGGSNTMSYRADPAGDNGRWEAIGPSKITSNATGRISTIAVSPVDPNTIYAGGRDEGLWKTTGATTTWFPMTDALPTLEIDAVAIDPANPNRVMVVTPAGVFQSLNGGSMWQQVSSQSLNANGSDGGKLLITGAQPMQALYVTTSSGLQVSIDQGVTWNPVLANESPIISLQFDTTVAGQLFASAAMPPAAFEATNGGLSSTSWHQLQGCPDAPLPTFPAAANVWITESQGTQWISFRGKAADTPSFGLWRSTSETCTIGGFPEHGWQQIAITGDCNDFRDHWSYLFAHPLDPTVVFKGGVALCRSSASGDNLSTVSNIHADHHAVAVAPSSPDLMFFGSDGGIYRSADKGQTVTFMGEGMYNTEFLKIDVNGAGAPHIIVGGSQDNDASAWDGTSPIWTDIGDALSSGDVPLLVFERSDQKGVYLMGQSTQQIEYYPASGDPWTQRSSLQDCDAYSEFPGKVFESMESTGTNPPLLVTCSGIWSGPPWTEIQQAPMGDAFVRLRLAPGLPLVGVAATTNGHVFWGGMQAPPTLLDVFPAANAGSPSAIAMVNQNIFYVATNLKTNAGLQGTITGFTCLVGGGCNTENIWPQIPPGKVTALGFDPLAANTVLAAISGQGIFRGTRDSSGQWTWVSYNNGIPVGANITDIEARSDGLIAAAAYGRGVFLLGSGCPPGLTSCAGNCVDTASDPLNCGGCGNVCRAPKLNCVAGGCTPCPLGTQSCCGGEFCRKTCPICP